MTTQLTIPATALSVAETLPFTALAFKTRATLPTITQYDPVPEQLFEEAARLGLQPAGPIQFIYTGVTGDETVPFDLEIALPVSGEPTGSSAFVLKTFDAFRHVNYTFVGPWAELMPMYDVLFATLYREGYKPDNRLREVYTIPDFEIPENCVTNIQVGLAEG
ncbi:GyrI-like domain-containing protein [Rudanella paleaurantiibacter]|uniref:GyrI-like domain-containing protein n=1 Tax=Rudanella paleaurantiibacter TaxID=2614655 RepID=A0A7J5U521_9BACT|nr:MULTISPECIES: hypothetical protein [Rudanella]KAB7732687.1 GyrI-like domain-containing protein [Rudanella paleaurantiibacter]